MKDQEFLVGQKAFINKDGEVLVLNDPVLGLDFPGGKIQEGETNFTDSLKREVLEETGLRIEVGEPFAQWHLKLTRGQENAGETIYLVGFKCKYLSGDVKISDEHDSYKWVNKSNYKELADGSDYFKVLKKYFLGS